jgi:hypothetical protein
MFGAPAQFESKKFAIVVSGARHLMSLRASGVSPAKDGRLVESIANSQRFAETRNILQNKIDQKEQRIVRYGYS